MIELDPDKVEFNPPYTIFGSGSISWFLKDFRESSIDFTSLGLKPIKIFGYYLGISIFNYYKDEKQTEEGNYQEIIYSTLVRKSFRIYAFAEKLDLDSNFHVVLGRKYYNLPKELDKNVNIDEFPPLTVKSNFLKWEFRNKSKLQQFFTWPLRIVISWIADLGTKFIPVLGINEGKGIYASIRIKPSKYLHSVMALDSPKKYVNLWSQYWPSIKVVVNKPNQL